MLDNKSSHSISGVFTFLLLSIFAVFSMVMVLLGARAYHSAGQKAANNNESRIAYSYLRSMVRNCDEKAAVKVLSSDGIDCISLEEADDEDVYVTMIYAYDGKLREWYAESSAAFVPENGEAICSLDKMTPSVDGDILRVELFHDNERTECLIALRSGN